MSSRTIPWAVVTALFLAACGDATRAPTMPLRADVATDPSSCSFAIAGATMTLAADCATDATITILSGFTLNGNDHTITAVDPGGGHFVGAVVRNGGDQANVENLTVAASNLTIACDAGDNRLRGILFQGASGSITNNTVIDINQGASGCQEGNGIEVRNAPFDGTHPNTQVVVIAGNTVTNYQKTGIVANGDVAVVVTGNTTTGAGPVPYIAQNGIQVGFGGVGEVSGNTISANFYTGCSHQAAAMTGCVPYTATGLLLYDVDANSVKTNNNMLRENQSNYRLVTEQSLDPDP